MKKSIGKILLLSSLTTALVACGGGSGGGAKVVVTISSSSAVTSSSQVISSAAQSSALSNSSISSDSTSSTSSISSAPVSSSSSVSSTGGLYSTPLKDLADFPIGVAVELDGTASLFSSTKQQEVVAHHFDQLTAGNHMKMSYLQSSQGNFHYTQADRMVEWAEENGLSIHGHALVWHSDYQVPQFMKNFNGTSEQFLTLVDTHARTVATHFAGKVDSWDVVNEAFLDDGQYRNTGNEGSIFYQKAGGKAFIAKAFRAAREADSVADLYYNDYSTEQNGPKLNAVIQMVNELMADGVPIDGIGFQMHVMLDWPSTANIKASFEKAAATGLKVKITELDVPINNPYNGTYSFENGVYEKTFTSALAQKQKARYCNIVKAYLEAVPANQRGGITIWGVADDQSWLISQLFKGKHDDWPLLFNKDYEEKPALLGVADALQGKPCQ